jgi:hypothetical protein
MGGSSDDAPKQRRRASTSPRSTTDPCDLEFSIDLVGVRPKVVAGLAVGSAMTVAIDVHGSARSVVCKADDGGVAGALAAFVGLAQLINCLDGGSQFEATVLTASSTQCKVLVRRV